MKHFSVFVHRQNALLNMFWINIISHDSYKPQNVRQTLKQTLKDCCAGGLGSGESAQNPFNAIIDTENVPPSFLVWQGGFHMVCRKNENHRNCIFRLDSFVGFPETQTTQSRIFVCVCVLILSFTGIPFNATQKKLVFIVAQGRQAAVVVLGSSVIKLLSLFYTFYNLCVVDDTPLFLGIRSVSHSWNILDMCAVLSIECVCAFCGRPSMC